MNIGILNQKLANHMDFEDKPFFTLNMLYDYWLIYLYRNDLIKEQYVYPDNLINKLFKKEYKKYGASEVGFLLTTFLRMLSTQIKYDNIESNINPLNLHKQAEELRNIRIGYQI